MKTESGVALVALTVALATVATAQRPKLSNDIDDEAYTLSRSSDAGKTNTQAVFIFRNHVCLLVGSCLRDWDEPKGFIFERGCHFHPNLNRISFDLIAREKTVPRK